MLVIGTSPLNVSNIAWLAKGDALFNYVGWEIFRQGPWTNPVGLNPNYGLEFGSSIVYSDSVPILAIFFKIFSRWLVQPFQYFGIWLLICFVSQAFFGCKLAELITKNKWIQISISIIFLFTPVMFFRTNVHLALAGHFFILWAIYLNLKKNVSGFSWAPLIIIVLGVHFYLFVIVIGLWVGSLLDRAISTKNFSVKSTLVETLFIFLLVYICAWQYGYLAIATSSSSAAGYGGDQFNIVAFFNPLSWSLLIPSNIFIPPTIEGFAYVGLGVIGALIIGLFQLSRRGERQHLFQKIHQHQFLLVVVILMLLIAITGNVDIGNSHYSIPIGERLLFVLNIVRASARLSWPFQYLIIFTSFWLIINGYRKGVVILFLMLAVLQVVDTSKGWVKIHQHFSSLKGRSIEHPLTGDFWKEAPKLYSTIKLVPPQNWPEGWHTFAPYAVENKMGTNAVFLARHDELKVQQAKLAINNELLSGRLNPNTIYVFQNWSSNINQVDPVFDASRDLFARINGVTVLAPNYKACKECKSIDPALEIDSAIPSLPIGKNIEFSKGEMGAMLLIDGWSHSESWGTWSIGPASRMAIPMGKNRPSKLRLHFRGLVGPKHQFTDMRVKINGEDQQIIRVAKQANNVADINIPESLKGDRFITVKFEYLNPTNPKIAGFGNDDERMLTIGIESLRLLK